jgi:hypothetical protein
MAQEAEQTAAQWVAEAWSRTENLTPDDVATEMAGGAALAADTLRSLGYVNLAHLDGRIKAWRRGPGRHSAAFRDH